MITERENVYRKTKNCSYQQSPEKDITNILQYMRAGPCLLSSSWQVTYVAQLSEHADASQTFWICFNFHLKML